MSDVHELRSRAERARTPGWSDAPEALPRGSEGSPEGHGGHSDEAVHPRAAGRSLGVGPGRARTRCLLTTLHPERGLSNALIQHLRQELPGIEFTLRVPSADAEGSLAAVWICGYSPGNAGLVRNLRARHPHATLIVTGRGPTDAWEDEVLAAGADSACSWPLPYPRLSALLKG